MHNLKVIETKGMRVLTSRQLAEMYNAEEWRIKQNFKVNKRKYELGKHYIVLEGEELKQFKTRYEIHTLKGKEVENSYLVGKNAKILYLWTEKGALLHAKSINTDKAWEVYDYLVDFYFRIKEEKPETKVEKVKTGSSLVVDAPANPEILDAIRKIQDDTICMNVLLENMKRYISKERYEEIRSVAADLVIVNLVQDWTVLMRLQPNMIEKRH